MTNEGYVSIHHTSEIMSDHEINLSHIFIAKVNKR